MILTAEQRFYDETGELKSCFREKHKGAIKPLPEVFTSEQMIRCAKHITWLIAEYGDAFRQYDTELIKFYINGWWAQDPDSIINHE